MKTMRFQSTQLHTTPVHHQVNFNPSPYKIQHNLSAHYQSHFVYVTINKNNKIEPLDNVILWVYQFNLEYVAAVLFPIDLSFMTHQHECLTLTATHSSRSQVNHILCAAQPALCLTHTHKPQLANLLYFSTSN